MEGISFQGAACEELTFFPHRRVGSQRDFYIEQISIYNLTAEGMGAFQVSINSGADFRVGELKLLKTGFYFQMASSPPPPRGHFFKQAARVTV